MIFSRFKNLFNWVLRISYPVWVQLSVLIVTCMVFSRFHQAEYLNWDDGFLIVSNPILQLNFFEAIRHAFEVFIIGDFLPFFQLSYWVESRLFGLTAPQSILINLMIHILNIWLALKWFKIRNYSPFVATFVIFVFAIHPLQVESVMWASERKGLLAALFTLLTLINYEKLRTSDYKSSKHFLLVFIFFLFSLFSKATSILLPLVLLGEVIYSGSLRGNQKRILTFFAGLFVVISLYSYIRISSQAQYLGGPIAETWNWNRIVVWFWSLFPALGHYVKTFLYPLNLSIMYPPYSHMKTIWAELASLVAFLFLILFVGFKGSRQVKGNMTFLLLFGLLLLAPVLNFVPRGNFVNDRYLYMVVISFAFVFAYYITILFSYRTASVIFCSLILLMSFISYDRVQVFSNSFNLWSDSVSVYPENQTAWNNLSIIHRDAGNYFEAVANLEKALEITSEQMTPRGQLYLNLARLRLEKNQPAYYNPQMALFYLKKAKESANNLRIDQEIEQEISLARASSAI